MPIGREIPGGPSFRPAGARRGVEEPPGGEYGAAPSAEIEFGDEPTGCNLADQQRQEAHVPPSIEDRRSRDDQPLASRDVVAQRIVERGDNGKEYENERLRMK